MRMGNPFIVDANPTPSRLDLPDGFFEIGGTADGAQSFLFINPNLFWVRFAGSIGAFAPVTSTTGYLFPPGFFGVFTSRFSGDFNAKHLSVMSVPYQGLSAGTGNCEISYGGGA